MNPHRLLAAFCTAALLAGASACDESAGPVAAASPVDFGEPLVPLSGPLRQDGDTLVAEVRGGGELRLSATTLAVTARVGGGRVVTLADPARGLGRAGRVSWRRGTATWRLSGGFHVSARVEDGRLVVDLRSAGEGELTWPVTATDGASLLALPSGDGLGIPVADPWWNSAAAGLTRDPYELAGGLTMPFWGYTLGSYGVGYIVPTDIGTSLKIVSSSGRLHTEATHQFSEGNRTRDYTVVIALTSTSPVASAVAYRAWLKDHHSLGSLDEKIRRNPAAGKLIGAFHAYLWGDARTLAGIRRMRELGLGRMWLGYDSDGHPLAPDAVAEAKRAGYLVGPYDTWDNAQDPKTADTPSSVWPGRLWPEGCVVDASGKVVTGFQNRGCYLSSEALGRPPGLLAARTGQMIANGADSYFLDVDAAGELFRDHSPRHPMTQARDRANRLARMAYVSGERRLVLGSETAASWANEVIAFSHGSATPATWFLWPLERDREFWGAYWPPDSPGHLFKPVNLPADALRGMFDPAYRLPLYETVLHDSVISLDRWELSLFKISNAQAARHLLAMLYNTPLMFALDGPTLDEHGERIAELRDFFDPLQRAAGTKPLTGFQWLTPDRLVQRTTFADGALTVTANFGPTAYRGLPPGCVQADIPGQPPRQLCQ